jgi:DegV family protein with EDD domain
MVDTLEYLRRGGRIGRAQSLLGSLLSIKPILNVERGEMAPFERVRSRAKAVDRLAQLAVQDQRIKRLFVAGADNDEAAYDLIDRVKAQLPHTEILWARIGPVVGVHSGPGLIGISTMARA